MSPSGHTIFDTAIGRCGLAWSGDRLAAVCLPERDDAELESKLTQKIGDSVRRPPPAWVRDAIARITSHVAGRPADLGSLPLALDHVTPTRARIYDAARRIPRGSVATYGELAERIGSPGAARAVGQAMAQNPFPIIVPCHRVVAAGARPGGFSAAGGLDTKRRLLASEGALLPGAPTPELFDDTPRLPYDVGAAVRALSAADPKLGALITRVGPCRLELEARRETHEALGRAILYQQLHGKAAATILRRLEALHGDRFPSPRELARSNPEQLRAVGVSGPKAAALRDLGARVLSGEVPRIAELETLDDEAVISRVTCVRGIGRWTAEMLLLFRLGRPDVLPVDDFGVRAGFGRVFLRGRHATADEVTRRGEKWRPWRSVASWYLWRATELD